MPPQREPVAAIDHAWLRMDQPTNAMVITALVVFDEAPGFEQVSDFVRDRLLLEPRFRQRVVSSRVPLGGPHWELDTKLDFEAHLHHVALPDPGGDLELSALISDIATTPLPHDRPLWQVYYVDGYGRGAAIVTRVHHAVGDGVALVRMLLGLSQEAGGSAAEVGVEAPSPHGALDAAKQIGAQAATLGRLLLLPSDPKTPLKGPLGRRKHTVFSRAFPLERIKAVARELGATTNDFLLTAITGALRSYLISRHFEVDGVQIRAMVPVYVKPKRAADGLGNHFGLVFVSLPVELADRNERLRELVRRTEEIKAAPDAVVALEVLAALGVGSSELESVAIDLFTRKASVMVTNIPGPRERIVLAGKPVSSMVVWAPVSGHLGVGLSAMTYAGQLRLGVAVDAGLISDPETLRDAFEAELDSLIA